MAEIKTKPTDASVEDFLNAVKDEQKRKDSFVILEMMKKSGESRRVGTQPRRREQVAQPNLSYRLVAIAKRSRPFKK